MHFSIDRTVHTTAFDKPVVDHWLERKIAQTAQLGPPRRIDPTTDRFKGGYASLRKDGRKEMFYLMILFTHLVIVI